jgi:hypothetical protein
MDWQKKTTDWQVCCLGQIAGGAGVAGGWFLFCFYSAEAGGSAYFVFSGIGMGVGGNASGILNPEDYGAVSAPWSGMSSYPWICGVNPFSANDLSGATGRISSLGGGVYVVGYSITYISASPFSSPDDYYFFSQNVGGLGYGASSGSSGASGEVLKGAWTFLKEASLRPS